ncbi:hypothetical protein ACB098_05G136500 [Castanea mollissima]
MPLISSMVHPWADLWSLKTFNNLPSCSSFNAEEITTGKVSPRPKYAYLRPLGSGLSSSCGASSLEGIGFLSLFGISLKRGLHPSLIAITCCPSKTCEESNKEQISDK